MYTMQALEIKEKNRNVRKNLKRASMLVRNLKIYIFYRLAGPAFQSVVLFWK